MLTICRSIARKQSASFLSKIKKSESKWREFHTVKIRNLPTSVNKQGMYQSQKVREGSGQGCLKEMDYQMPWFQDIESNFSSLSFHGILQNFAHNSPGIICVWIQYSADRSMIQPLLAKKGWRSPIFYYRLWEAMRLVLISNMKHVFLNV